MRGGYVRKQYHGTPPLTSFKESLLDILLRLTVAYLSSVMRLKHLTLKETLKILLEKDTALYNKITVSNLKDRSTVAIELAQ